MPGALMKVDAPTGLTGRPFTSNVYLWWDPVDGADQYWVRVAVQGHDWFHYATPLQTSYTRMYLVGFDQDTTYVLQVSARGDGVTKKAEWGPWSSSFITTTGPPPAPSLGGSVYTDNVILTWVPIDGADNYMVSYPGEEEETSSPGFRAENLTANTEYTFTVKAYGDGTRYVAEWGPGDSHTATTGPPPAPAAPSFHSATESSVTFTLTRMAGTTHYKVGHRESGTSSWTITQDHEIPASGQIKHTISGLAKDTTYEVQVGYKGDGKKYNLTGYGSWSSSGTFDTLKEALPTRGTGNHVFGLSRALGLPLPITAINVKVSSDTSTQRIQAYLNTSRHEVSGLIPGAGNANFPVRLELIGPRITYTEPNGSTHSVSLSSAGTCIAVQADLCRAWSQGSALIWPDWPLTAVGQVGANIKNYPSWYFVSSSGGTLIRVRVAHTGPYSVR